MDDTKYTLTEHLSELRGRLLKSFLGIIATTAVCAAFAPQLLTRAIQPLQAVLREKNRVETLLIHPDAEARRQLTQRLDDDRTINLRGSFEGLAAIGPAAQEALAEERPIDLILVSSDAIGAEGQHAGDAVEGIEPAPSVVYLVKDAKDPNLLELSLEGAAVILDPPKKASLARVVRRAAGAAGKAAQAEKLVVLSPLDPFFAYLKIALVCGLFLACPVWLYQLWRFVEPGLYAQEKGVVLPAVLTGSVMFAGGGAFAYFIMFPVMFDVLVNQMMPAAVSASFTVDNYLNLLLTMTVAFGAIFELPLVLALASGVGLVDPATLVRYRKFAIIGSFIVGGVLTPTADPISQLMMAGPLVLFYEIGIVAGRVLNKRRLAKLAQAERALEKAS